MSDINFTVDQAIAPVEATANNIVYVKDITLQGNLLLEQGKIYATDNKIYSSTGKIRMPNAVAKTLYTGKQVVNATTSPTITDNGAGQYINLYQTSSTVIQWSNLLTEGIRFFKIKRIHDTTSSTYNLSFATTPGANAWYREGRQNLILTQAPSAKDDIYGWVDSAGNTVTFNPILNYGVDTTRTGQIPQEKRTPNSYNVPVPNGATVPDGAVCTTMSNLSMNATDIVYDGNETFISQVILDQITAKKANVRHSFATSSSTFTIDLSKDDFISLTHNSNIDTFDIIQSDPDYSTPCIIWRMKDDSSTPRTINFSEDVFRWGIDPQLTQFNLGIDAIVIKSYAGVNNLAVFNDFNDLG